MKNKIAILSVFCFIVLISTSCTSSNQQSTYTDSAPDSSETVNNEGTEGETIKNSEYESIFNSYYFAQSNNLNAFKVLQSKKFTEIIEDWVDENLNDIKNPVWNYDSFTQYQILDGGSISSIGDDLFYCTFSADNDKYGYVILQYDSYSNDGSALGRVAMVETTPYLYDLKENINDILTKLNEFKLDLSKIDVIRGQIVDGENSEEVILFTDNNKKYLFYFKSSEIVEIQ